VEAAETFLRSVDGIHDGLGVFAEGAACIGEAHLLAVALEELYAKCLFERFDLEGNGGLAHVERTSRLTVVEKVR
jgi:hypothetical protein